MPPKNIFNPLGADLPRAYGSKSGSQAHRQSKEELWPERGRGQSPGRGHRQASRERSRTGAPRRHEDEVRQPRVGGSSSSAKQELKEEEGSSQEVKQKVWQDVKEEAEQEGESVVEEDDDLREFDHKPIKHNLQLQFQGMGGQMKTQRLEDYMDNIYLSNAHVIVMCEYNASYGHSIEATGKFRVFWQGELAVFVHALYVRGATMLIHESFSDVKRQSSSYAIWKIEWDGVDGGVEETVIAVFHLHRNHAKGPEMLKKIMGRFGSDLEHINCR